MQAHERRQEGAYVKTQAGTQTHGRLNHRHTRWVRSATRVCRQSAGILMASSHELNRFRRLLPTHSHRRSEGTFALRGHRPPRNSSPKFAPPRPDFAKQSAKRPPRNGPIKRPISSQLETPGLVSSSGGVLAGKHNIFSSQGGVLAGKHRFFSSWLEMDDFWPPELDPSLEPYMHLSSLPLRSETSSF